MNRGWGQIPVTTATVIPTALTSITEDPSGVGRVVSGVFDLKLPAKGKASSLGVGGCLFFISVVCCGHKHDQSPRLALTEDGINTVSKFTA